MARFNDDDDLMMIVAYFFGPPCTCLYIQVLYVKVLCSMVNMKEFWKWLRCDWVITDFWQCCNFIILNVLSMCPCMAPLPVTPRHNRFVRTIFLLSWYHCLLYVLSISTCVVFPERSHHMHKCWLFCVFRAQMRKVMVTVLRHNVAAQEFFVNKLK